MVTMNLHMFVRVEFAGGNVPYFFHLLIPQWELRPGLHRRNVHWAHGICLVLCYTIYVLFLFSTLCSSMISFAQDGFYVCILYVLYFLNKIYLMLNFDIATVFL